MRVIVYEGLAGGETVWHFPKTETCGQNPNANLKQLKRGLPIFLVLAKKG